MGTVAPATVCSECATNSRGACAPKKRRFSGGQHPTPMPAREMMAGTGSSFSKKTRTRQMGRRTMARARATGAATGAQQAAQRARRESAGRSLSSASAGAAAAAAERPAESADTRMTASPGADPLDGRRPAAAAADAPPNDHLGAPGARPKNGLPPAAAGGDGPAGAAATGDLAAASSPTVSGAECRDRRRVTVGAPPPPAVPGLRQGAGVSGRGHPPPPPCRCAGVCR